MKKNEIKYTNGIVNNKNIIKSIRADVSKCSNNTCPSKQTCLRFTGESLDKTRQVYTNFQWDVNTNICKDHKSNRI